jgi:hypothetical protein
MANIKEDFTKLNDYTLRVEHSEERSHSNTRLRISHARTFNFLARQVETIHSENLYDYKNDVPVSLSTYGRVESFDELPSSLEIKFMHAKLIEMEGKPPALEEILPNEMHKKSGGGIPTLGGQK